MSEHPRGRFVWHDLMTTDPDGAVGFYTAVAGWGTDTWDGMGPDNPYTMWMAGEGNSIGGVVQLPAEAQKGGVPAHWLTYVATPDVDATVEQAIGIGGHVRVPPTDIPTVGRFAVLVDPQGGQFAAFTAAEEAPGHDGPAELGEMSWHELATTDWRAAFEFYSALFGWEKVNEHDMGEMGIYFIFGKGGAPLGGMFDKPAEMPGPPGWLPYIRVADVNATEETVEAQGGRVVNGPMEVPGGDWVAQGMDPQGAMFAVHEVKG